MPAKRAGSIVINFSAGTGQFNADVAKATATVRNFGKAGVSEARATTAALKTLEGGILNNSRAADQFLEKVLHLGPAMQVAFPVVGAIAFVGVLGDAAKKVDEFFEKMRTAPMRLTNAFRDVTSPLRQASDELAVVNAKLQNDIGKLEGKRENGLALALAEARVQADKLADSLDANLQKISQVMKAQEVSFLSGLFTGRQSTAGNTEEQEKFAQNMALINERGNASVRAASVADLDANDQAQTRTRAAQTKWNQEVSAALDAEIKGQERLLELAQLQQKIHEGTATPADREKAYDLRYPGERQPGQVIATNRGAPDQTLNIIDQEKRLQDLNFARDIQSTTVAIEAAARKKTALEEGAANAALGRPFEDRMKAMSAALDGIKVRMAAIGQGEAAEVLAKSFADAQKTIEEVNKSLEDHHTKLTKNQEDQIRNKAYATASAEAEAAWKTKLDSTTDSIENRIRSMRLLTAAIGAGYEATRRASVETSVMNAPGVGKNYGDKDWMAAHQYDVSGLRAQFGQQYDTQHSEETGKAIYTLQQQIDLEKALAKAQVMGAEAVRFATLMHNLKTIAQNNDAESARRLIAGEVEKYRVERENTAAAALAKINEETAATERLTAAVWKGAEAIRQAGLENKYAAMKRGGAAPQEIEATKVQDVAAHQEQLSVEAAKMATGYSDALDHISQLAAKLEEAKQTQGDTIGIETALRDLENERLHILSEQALKMGGLKDGVHAFFLDMQQSAEKASTIIYDALHSALDKTSNELANLLTGQKTNWGKMLQDIGHKMVQDSIKSLLRTGLGKLGGGSGTKADGSRNNPFYVVSAGGIGAPGTVPGSISGVSKPGDATFGNGGLLGTGNIPRVVYGQDISIARSGQIGDTVASGDTLAGTGQPGGGGGAPGLIQAGVDGYQDDGVLGAAGNVGLTLLGKLFHVGKSNAPGGATGKPDGSPAKPFGVYVALGRPDGTSGNPLNVVMPGGGPQKPIDFGPNLKQPSGPNGLQKAGGIISGIASTVGGFFGLPIPNLSSVGSSGGGGSNTSESVHYDMGPYGGGSSVPDSGGDFGGGLAAGGPVRTGKHYIVGERGPELFRSSTAGHIIDHETTKRMARAGALPAGIRVPGVVSGRASARPMLLEARADGGDVSAGNSYMVGERGPEAFFPGSFSSDQDSRRTQGNGGNVAYYTIDARGTDPNLVEQRVRQALVQVHKSAISTAIQGNVERSKRVPG